MKRTNCYAYAFDIINNPVSGNGLYSYQDTLDSHGKLAFAAQPGLFSGQYKPYDNSIVLGTEVANQKLVDFVKDDARAMGLDFQEYESGMSGGYAVLLVISPNNDYHWYRQDVDGTWSHKRGATPVMTGVTDPVQNAINLGYTTIVGYYYITEACDID